MEYLILYAVDGALLLLLVLSVVRCAHLGLVRSLAGIIAWVAAAAVAMHFCAPLAETCYDNYLQKPVLAMAENYIRSSANKTKDAVTSSSAFSGITSKIKDGVSSKLKDGIQLPDNITSVTGSQEVKVPDSVKDAANSIGAADVIRDAANSAGLPDIVKKATNGAGIPDVVSKVAKGAGLDLDAMKKKVAQIPQNSASALERNLLAPIIKTSLKVALFFAIIALVSGLIRLVLKPVGKVLHKTPVIGTTDRALGATLGILKGAVLVATLALLLRIVGAVAEGDIGRAVQNSKIISIVANSSFADGLFRQ